MEKREIKPSDKIFFINDLQPMEVIALSERFAVCVRGMDLQDDFELLAFEVERGAYYDSEAAYEALKDSPIYTILDFKENRRGRDNYIFGMYDYWSKEDCELCIKDLESGQVEISKTYGIDLNIDWKRTLEKQ